MSNSPVKPSRLLRDSFTYVRPIYIPMLTFFIPNLIITLLSPGISSPSASFFLSLINLLCIVPFVTGASIFYVHQKLTGRGATIPEALQKAGEKFIQLVLLTFLLCVILIPAFILLIIPCVYLAIRLSFVYYAVMIENRSALDAISRSWQLTKGHWWLIFWASSILILIIFIPAFIFGFLAPSIDPTLAEPAGGFIGFFLSPVYSTYYVFLFFSLVSLISTDTEENLIT